MPINTAGSSRPTITDANAPFNHPDAEIILRSSDQVDFRVFKLLLSLTSNFFKDMFTLPQAQTDNGDTIKGDRSLPVIEMSEDSNTLEALLRMCYPMAMVDPPVITELKSLRLLLEAAIKYDVERVEKCARGWLVEPRFLETDPLLVYAIACRQNWEKEARLAAKSTIGKPIFEKPLTEELDSMTARQLYGLLQFNRRCTNKVVKEVVNDYLWIDRNSFCWFNCGWCRETEEIHRRSDSRYTSDLGHSSSNWWERYMRNISGALATQTWSAEEKSRLKEEAVEDAQGCRSCCLKAREDLQRFGNNLDARIDEVVARIEFDLCF